MKRKKATRQDKVAAAKTAATEAANNGQASIPAADAGAQTTGSPVEIPTLGGGPITIPMTAAVNPRKQDVESLEEAIDVQAEIAALQGLEQQTATLRRKLPGHLVAIDEYEELGQGTQAQRDLQASLRPKIEKSRRAVEGFLRYVGDTPEEGAAIRHAAWMILYNHHFSKSFDSHEKVDALLERMVKTGQVLVCQEDEEDFDFLMYGQKYRCPANACLSPKDIDEIRAGVKALYSRTRKAVAEQQDVTAQELQREAFISLQELKAGKPGLCFVDAPTQHNEDRDNPDRTQHFEGGRLLVSSNGDIINIVKFVGRDGNRSFQHSLKETMRLRPRPFLKVAALGWSNPPFIKGLPAATGAKVRLLWHLIVRAIKAEDELKEQLSQPEEGTAATEESQK